MACGVAGGAVAWFTVDAVVIRIDEYFNRDAFESELRRFVYENRARTAMALRKALEDKGRKLFDFFGPKIEE